MNTIKSVINSVGYKRNLAFSILDLRELTSAPIFSEKPFVFLDTNILLWFFRINDDARKEIFSFLNSLKGSKRLWIPAWVIHEYNYHLEKLEDITFFSFRKAANEIDVNLKAVEKHSKLIVDDAYLMGSIYKGKEDFLTKLDETAKELRSLIKTLKNSRNKNLEDIRRQVDELISGCILNSDVDHILKEVSLCAEVRSQNSIPPGYLDSGKGENKYGDYIIWKEIICKCKENNISAIFITNDEKSDWIYTPKGISNENAKKIPNNGSMEIKINLPQPFLEYEFKKNIGKDKDFFIINIEMVTHLLSSVDFNPKNSHCYSNLATAVAIDLHETDTYSVIGWFLKNDDEYSHVIKTVAYWQFSPSEIDPEALKQYVKENILNVNVDKVDWTEVICELFI